MNYLPAEPMVHEYADERQRLRIARMIGLGAIAAVALLVGFGAWSQSSRSADTIAVLEARKNARAKRADYDCRGGQGTPHHRAAG